ncbi:MepB family protein [Leptospira jelokensis]|uniref:MepB protein n=1 Tax=Leptospira jelokensis TaxID=2484931 RepID=A0A4Z1AB07_9LEPT|nr:MepB protein [Leptospira jelokensis]
MIANVPMESDHPIHLKNLLTLFLNPLNVSIYELQIEKESFEYKACHFKCNQKKILFRSAKLTPKKKGLFVTLWKRNSKGAIQPFTLKDSIDLCIIEAIDKDQIGYFIFDKHTLHANGIISGKSKGKLGFRIYPTWTKPDNKQALTTQKWQIPYFYESNPNDSQWKSIAHLFGSG